jgi:hypothetical protein
VGASGEEVSHEAICVLNTSQNDALLSVSFYFEASEPIHDVQLAVPGERTRHFRLDIPDEIGGVAIPCQVPYAARIESSVPVFVQYSRLDCSTPHMALMTTTAVAGVE